MKLNGQVTGRLSRCLAAAALGMMCVAGLAHASEADWKVCEGRGDATAGIAACSRIISDTSQTAEERAGAYYVRGNTYADKEDYAQAIADYNKAIELNAENAWYFSSRCWALTENGESDRAIADCNKAIALRPQNPQAFLNRGAAREAKGQTQVAIADYRAALAVTAESDDDRAAQNDAKAALERLAKQPQK